MTEPTILVRGRVLRAGAKRPELLDVCIGSDGRIASIAPQVPRVEANVIDLQGKLVVPALVDAHQHLDKSRTRSLIRNSPATLEEASAAYRKYASSVAATEIADRAARTIERCLALGTTAIRNHTNIESGSQLRGIEAMIDLRERYRDRMTIQVVAHLTSDAPRDLLAARRWLEGAISLGVDVIGGVPQFAEDPVAFLDLLFAFAERSGLPLDMHIDEHLDEGKLLIGEVIERTRAHGMAGKVTAAHCCALSAITPDAAGRLIEGLAQAGIAIVTLPAANLFLQSRESPSLTPRGLTRVRELLDAGVRLAAASDNIQDPIVPTGSGDLLEIARWTLLAAHLGLTDLTRAFDMVTAAPAAIMGLGSWGIRPGARADLLITDADDQEDLLAGGALARTVLVGGRVVAGALPDAASRHG